MRLDKFLAECGQGSRTEVKFLLKKKRVTVNGMVETSSKRQIDTEHDQVFLDGQALTYEALVYYLLNKPKGVLSATEDAYQKTVLDLLDETARRKEVFPVGRLDKDTHGLLLLTNDGALAHELLSPKKHVDKVYVARVKGVMTAEDRDRFFKGIVLSDYLCQPADLQILEIDEQNQECRVQITLREGKFHQVKRMVAACGKEVVDLQRIGMGALWLDTQLPLGAWRRFTEEEQDSLYTLRSSR